MRNERRGLGRGLSALIPADEGGTLREISVDRIRSNPRQPREVFDEAAIAELAASIREVGILQPLLVREAEDGYELIAGERRLRAAREAGLDRVPAVVRHTDDADLLREALIENVHRADLNPLEEAAAYRQLLDEFGVTHDELARRVGKSRPAVTNALRLLGLPPPVQRRVAAGVLSAGHAKALLAIDSSGEQERVAERIVREGLSVRATEEVVRLLGDGEADNGTPVRAHERGRVRAPGLKDLEERLSDALMARVTVRMGARRGRLTVEFTSVDDLERVVDVIARGLGETVRLHEDPL